ncbi:hypothetical protein, partial [Staphylococcus hominis]|uniref:hypothetical protein n=1 Tax=Staphylococcus hominis TaxID=1290 RepID=UPI001C92BCAF
TKLNKLLEKPTQPFQNQNALLDCPQPQQLPFPTILQHPISIPFTPQHTQPPTFTHTHPLLHHQHNPNTYTPLHHLP